MKRERVRSQLGLPINTQDAWTDHWKITKNKDLTLPVGQQQMKGYLNHWKLTEEVSNKEERENTEDSEDEDEHEQVNENEVASYSSIHMLVNSSDVETFEDDFSFGIPAEVENETVPDIDTDAEIMEIYETPPNDRRLEFSPENIPRNSHASSSSCENSPSPINAHQSPSPFQSFRLTPDGITEVTQSPHGRRFKIKDGIIKEISSRNGFCDLPNMVNSPPTAGKRNSDNLSSGRRKSISSSIVHAQTVPAAPVSGSPRAPLPSFSERTLNFMYPPVRNTSPFAGMPGAVPPITTRKNNLRNSDSRQKGL